MLGFIFSTDQSISNEPHKYIGNRIQESLSDWSIYLTVLDMNERLRDMTPKRDVGGSYS